MVAVPGSDGVNGLMGEGVCEDGEECDGAIVPDVGREEGTGGSKGRDKRKLA